MFLNNEFVRASFESYGEKIILPINSSFIVTDETRERTIASFGEISYSTRGLISKDNGAFSVASSNSRVSAFKNGVLVDYCVTDEDGVYFLALEEGIYDIKIESNSHTRFFRNIEIKNGIKEYHEFVSSGQIKRKKHDTIEFVRYNTTVDDGKRLIFGKLLDEHEKPIAFAEIVVMKVLSNNSTLRPVKAFVKTDKNGEYFFVLDRENYDIIVRSPKHSAKVVKNFFFNPEKGFMTEISSELLVFQKDGDWIWILK